MRRVLLVALALSATWASPCGALERPRVAAAGATGPIRVDGVLDEADWARATAITDLRLVEDREGGAPSESTEVRVLFDATHLYVGARCWNRAPGAIRASLAPRDQILDLDYVGVLLDTYQDRHRAYAFAVNPYGVQLDGIFVGDDVNTEWDGVWDAEVTRDGGSGWTAEMAIPLRTLSFPERGSGAWGLIVRRQIAKNDEICTWPLVRASVAGDEMLQAADLTGLDSLRGAGLFDLQPYASAAWSTRRGGDGAWNDEDAHDVGVDARVPLTSTLVLSATVNPDFSQVEADALQIDVNQRYPLFYDEKRPFFLEGADIFGTAFDLIYTRRIADPAYGAKLTGRLGHARVGAIVVRDDGGGTLAGVGGGPSDGVSGKGWFQLGRVAWEFGENSSVGALVALHQTDAALAVPAEVPTAPYGVWNAASLDRASNAVYGLDADLRLSRRWFFHGQLAGSRTHADAVTWGIDWDSAGVVGIWDRVRATRNDLAYGAEFDYTDGIRELTLIHQYAGPDFRTESGFLSRVDFRRTRVNSDFYIRPQNAVLRSIQPILDGYVVHDHDGRLQEWWWSPMVDWKFQKQTHVHTMFDRWMERWQGRDYLGKHYILNVDNSQWRVLTLAFESEIGDGIYYGDDDASSYLGWLEQYVLEGTLRPSPRLTVELETARDRFSRDHGRDVVYDAWTLGAKATWQFTRRLYVRLYPQYDTDAEHLDADALVGYVLHPGSVLYLGYNGDADRLAGRHRATGHTAFLKVSYRFQR
jgi:hypothetical protein